MNRDLAFIAGALVTWGVGEGMFFLFQPLYLEELGADPLAIGGILGIIGVFMSIAHIPAGYLADRIGRRPLILAAWLFGMISTWVMALASTLPAFVVGSAMYGMTSFVMAPLNSYITSARGNWSLGRTLTTISATYNTGAILGPLLGGWIGERFGLRTNFYVAACLFMLSCLIIFFIRPQPTAGQEEEGVPKNGLHNLRHAGFVKALGLFFFVMFSMYLAQPLSQNFLQNERGISIAQIGTLISTRSVGIVVLNLTLGHLEARLGFLLAQIVMIFSSAAIWLGNGFGWYALGYLLIGSHQTARSLAIAQIRDLIEEAYMGLAYGLMETVMSFSIVIAPPLAGLLYEFNPPAMYLASILLISLALLLTIRTPIAPSQVKTQPTID